MEIFNCPGSCPKPCPKPCPPQVIPAPAPGNMGYWTQHPWLVPNEQAHWVGYHHEYPRNRCGGGYSGYPGGYGMEREMM